MRTILPLPSFAASSAASLDMPSATILHQLTGLPVHGLHTHSHAHAACVLGSPFQVAIHQVSGRVQRLPQHCRPCHRHGGLGIDNMEGRRGVSQTRAGQGLGSRDACTFHQGIAIRPDANFRSSLLVACW